MPKPFLSILLPASLTAEDPDLRQKTLKVGLVGRALAIFRVDKVVIYFDDDPRTQDQKAEADLIAKLLSYMETPQYLRKLLIPRAKELRYAGLLPPLRTPHHPRCDEKGRSGDYREAVVIEVGKGGSLLELGLPEKGFSHKKLKVGQRLTVKIGKRIARDRVAVEPVEKGEVGEYWGYEVSI
ncbi:MAG: RNA methyltransferase, partial [Hadesarchaea archaeon]|nr:RNA methyltransferase [Hadesarchaea archaeon]